MVGKMEVLTGLSLGKLEVKYFCLKGNFKVTPTGLLFLSYPITSKHSAFPITRISASKVPAVRRKFVSK